MKHTNKTARFSLCALAMALTTTTAMAAPTSYEPSSEVNPRFYTGIGYGQYSFEFDNDDLDTEFDDDAGMLEAYVGTQLNDYWSFELGYHNFDEVSDIDQQAELDGVSLSTKLALPVSERFKVYATAGWLEWDADLRAQLDDLTIATTQADGGDVFYGAGVQFAMTEQVRFNLEYERYELDEQIDPEMDVASVSVEYLF
ncbi:Outer membrane protein A precursor [Pseudoalteromonas sp. THAF3]|uniref:porin family protein n=1 Tax=Pseudoalteromonas TaxID=53246 RepID=UPI00034679FA|nr:MULTISPECIES: outer membrane beta-barrel protein [Pseudoalteromonas]QFU04991.1 Outer membrane protein A precursor [Pseudoalteromonas sp. THAF3]|tara:strand:+ start:14621 stop:15217 length:597 start_codon:yes stop_codon:yes gene_type:complete